ncbi:hypothetical protein KDA_36340 [Dictyobacter alpinus]|uniref:Uncharacterized protein n=1 Tax=Dictyobacter alpinus TaxID=2014873 RepID=A0A402BA17_9CHLR|nr:hypothetical protein KDA_36340 [Dictyobacter alpinus]
MIWRMGQGHAGRLGRVDTPLHFGKKFCYTFQYLFPVSVLEEVKLFIYGSIELRLSIGFGVAG